MSVIRLSVCLLAGLLLLAVARPVCAAPVRVGEVYRVTVFVSEVREGEALLVERPLETELTVMLGADGTVSSAILEVPAGISGAHVRVPAEEVPAPVAELFGDGGEMLFIATHQHFSSGAGRYDLARKVPELTAEEARKRGIQPQPCRPKDLLLVDPSGQPAAGLRAEVTMSVNVHGKQARVLVGSATLPADGRLSLKWPRTLAAEGMPTQFHPGQFAGGGMPELVVTDPSTGAREQHTLVFWRPPGAPKLPENLVALMLVAPANADTTVPLFTGVVRDANGTSVPARIGIGWLETPGRGGVQPGMGGMGGGTLLTPPDGTFRFGLPVTTMEGAAGQRTPPREMVLVVNVGRQDGVPGSTSARLFPGRENIVTLAHTETLTVRFTDHTGLPPTDYMAEAKNDRNVWLHPVNPRGRAERRHMIMNPVDDSGLATIPGVPVPDHFTLEWRGVRYEGAPVERGSEGRVLEFRGLKENARVLGRALNAATGEAVAGAYVACAFEGSALWTLATMDDAERDAIFDKAAAEGVGAVADKGGAVRLKGGMWHGVRALARTDAEGRFTLELPPGMRADGFSLYARGFVPVEMNATQYYSEEDRLRGEMTLADVALIPAARAKVTVKLAATIPDPFLRNEKGENAEGVTVNTTVSFTKPENWKLEPSPPNPTKAQPWDNEYAASWSSVNAPYEIFVPAGVKFSVSAGNSYKTTLGVAFWEDRGPAEAGTTVDLGAREIPVKRPFLIVVREPDGSPAAGVGVRVDGFLPLTTDERGEAIGWATGTVGRIEALPSLGWKVGARRENIEIPDTGDMVRVELTLSAGDAATTAPR